MVRSSTTIKTTAREMYGEVVVDNTTTGIRSRIKSLIVSLKSWKGGGMNDCNIAYFGFGCSKRYAVHWLVMSIMSVQGNGRLCEWHQRN